MYVSFRLIHAFVVLHIWLMFLHICTVITDFLLQEMYQFTHGCFWVLLLPYWPGSCSLSPGWSAIPAWYFKLPSLINAAIVSLYWNALTSVLHYWKTALNIFRLLPFWCCLCAWSSLQYIFSKIISFGSKIIVVRHSGGTRLHFISFIYIIPYNNLMYEILKMP